MAQRAKFVVDLQFLLGDTFIKTGTAVLWLAILLALYTQLTRPDLVQQFIVGWWGMLAAMAVTAIGLWQLGRTMRREATVTDNRTT